MRRRKKLPIMMTRNRREGDGDEVREFSAVRKIDCRGMHHVTHKCSEFASSELHHQHIRHR
jgi:hypothetical protein